MDDMVGFYRGKRVLVTGDTGFKGSWLSLWLWDMGAEVVGFALPPEQDVNHYQLINLGAKIRHVDGDIRDESALSRVFSSFQPEILFHLAAQPIVRRSYLDPKDTFGTNVGGSVNVLEQVRQAKSLRSLIYVTSDKCYRNKEWVWGYRENDELGGHDPYSASKAAAEIVFASYSDSFFRKNRELGAASVRAGNVIGGGDWSADRIVPDCVRALCANEPVMLRFPAATRPWQHVLEPLGGYLQLARKLWEEPERFFGSWNFGPDSDAVQNVETLAKCFVKAWGNGSVETRAEQGNLHEAGRLVLNCDKAKQMLKWVPRWSFETTVTETAQWYKHWAEGKDMRGESREQIQRYLEGVPQ